MSKINRVSTVSTAYAFAGKVDWCEYRTYGLSKLGSYNIKEIAAADLYYTTAIAILKSAHKVFNTLLWLSKHLKELGMVCHHFMFYQVTENATAACAWLEFSGISNSNKSEWIIVDGRGLITSNNSPYISPSMSGATAPTVPMPLCEYLLLIKNKIQEASSGKISNTYRLPSRRRQKVK